MWYFHDFLLIVHKLIYFFDALSVGQMVHTNVLVEIFCFYSNLARLIISFSSLYRIRLIFSVVFGPHICYDLLIGIRPSFLYTKTKNMKNMLKYLNTIFNFYML